MAFVESFADFFGDFGVICIANGITFTGILDMPDSEYTLGHGMVQSREFKLTYQTSLVVLKGGDAISVGGVAYTVRSYPNTIDDGQLTEAMLSKA